jgi:hypothetical protein
LRRRELVNFQIGQWAATVLLYSHYLNLQKNLYFLENEARELNSDVGVAKDSVDEVSERWNADEDEADHMML